MKKLKSSSSSSSNSYEHVSHLSEFKYLPPEVCTQILATLPVETLLKVSKVLLSVERFRIRGQKSLGYMMTVRLAETLGKPTNIFKSVESYSLYGNCDGLLLMCRRGDDNCLELTIRNLSCRKSLLLSPCPFPQFYFALSDFVCVFGFASQSMEYKVILITIERYKVSDMMNFAVYTLSDQQWNVKNNGSGISREYFKRMFESSPRRKYDCYFQGAAHWFGNDPDGDGNCRMKHTHLVSLNFNSEKFTFLELPYTSGEQETLWFMFYLGESLAIFCISSASSNIWVLEQDSGKRVWTSWFSGFSSKAGFKLFKSYSKSHTMVFYYKSADGSQFIRCDRNSYNLDDCRVKRHGKSIKSDMEPKT